MKYSVGKMRQYMPWLLLLFGVDGFASLLLWIADAEAFYAMAAAILLATVLLFVSVCVLLCSRERKREEVFFSFLENPDGYHEELLLKTVGTAQEDAVHRLGETLRDKTEAYQRLQSELADYEEYVEAWAHETKTPLSLLSLLLDNRREELPAKVGYKLDYIRNRMQESINQMLYYARLKSARKDYLFEQVELFPCVEEVLEEYRPLLEEKQFRVSTRFSSGKVCTDRRGLHFLLGQVVSNAVRYSGKEPELVFTFDREAAFYVLCIRDNGTGVRGCDLPYIFEKGFTGGMEEGRKSATGMGLYLAKEIAKDMALTLDAQSEWGRGFEMQIRFPVVND